MLKELFKSFFHKTSAVPDIGFPTPNMFLERPLRDLYYAYYHQGAGMVILAFILGLFVLNVVIGDKATKSIAKLSILLIALVWVTPQTIAFRYSAYHLSPLYLPALNLPLVLIYLILGVATVIIIQATRNFLKSVCSVRVCRLVDFHLFLFAAILFLPWISGETWIDWL